MNRREIQSAINKLIAQLGETLRGWVKRAQTSLFERIAGILDGLETEGGRIARNAANTALQGDVASAVTVSQNGLLAQLLPWLVRNVRRLVSLNGDYYQTRNEVGPSIRDTAIRQVLLSLGYDNQTRQIVSGTYLDNLTGDNLKRQVLSRVSSAIAGRSTIAGFRKTFRQDFIGRKGLGLVEKEFANLSGNLFADVSRTTGLVYAEELDLTHAIYSHGRPIPTTRKFCCQRINGIYTKEEIERWDGLTWAGKRTSTPTTVAMGGWQCRGVFRWITKELAETLAKQRGIEINALIPCQK